MRRGQRRFRPDIKRTDIVICERTAKINCGKREHNSSSSVVVASKKVSK